MWRTWGAGVGLFFCGLGSGAAGVSAASTLTQVRTNQSLAPRRGLLAVSCRNTRPVGRDTRAPSAPWILWLLFAEHLPTVRLPGLVPEGHAASTEGRDDTCEDNGSPGLITEGRQPHAPAPLPKTVALGCGALDITCPFWAFCPWPKTKQGDVCLQRVIPRTCP